MAAATASIQMVEGVEVVWGRLEAVAAMDGDDEGDGMDEAERAVRAFGVDGITLRGRHVRAMRAAIGLSARELARMVQCSWQTIYAWEAEVREIPSQMYLPLVEALAAERKRRARWIRVAWPDRPGASGIHRRGT